MYPFPPDRILAELVGQELVQICVSANTVTLHFSRDFMTIEVDFEFVDSTDNVKVSIPSITSRIFDLIGAKVSRLDVGMERHTLSIEFSGHRWLRFISDRQYESVHFMIRDTEYHV